VYNIPRNIDAKNMKESNSWSTLEKLIWVLIAIVGIGIIGVLIGLAFVPPDKPTQLGTLAQSLAAFGVLVTAVIMWMSVREIRRQAEQQRSQWEREREAAAKPLLMYDRAWLGGPERSLGVIITNIGRPLTGLSGFLLLTDLSSAQAEWAKGRYPGGSTVEGIIVQPVAQAYAGGRQKDIEPGEDAQFSFEAHSILGGGKQFTLVLEYWDLEGRAYRAAWEFMTQGQDLEGLWVDFRNQMPAQRVPHKDRW